MSEFQKASDERRARAATRNSRLTVFLNRKESPGMALGMLIAAVLGMCFLLSSLGWLPK